MISSSRSTLKWFGMPEILLRPDYQSIGSPHIILQSDSMAYISVWKMVVNSQWGIPIKTEICSMYSNSFQYRFWIHQLHFQSAIFLLLMAFCICEFEVSLASRARHRFLTSLSWCSCVQRLEDFRSFSFLYMLYILSALVIHYFQCRLHSSLTLWQHTSPG